MKASELAVAGATYVQILSYGIWNTPWPMALTASQIQIYDCVGSVRFQYLTRVVPSCYVMVNSLIESLQVAQPTVSNMAPSYEISNFF